MKRRRNKSTWTKKTRPKSRGRPKGSKDRYPRKWGKFPGSMKAVFARIAEEHPDTVFNSLLRGLEADAPRNAPFLQMMTVAIDGKQADVVPLERVEQLIMAMTALFLEIVTDVEQKRRWSDGVRRLTGLAARQVIDAQSPNKS